MEWIQAAIMLAEDPQAKVRYPNCRQYYLYVSDEQVDDDHIDRHLKCPECNAHEVIFRELDRRSGK